MTCCWSVFCQYCAGMEYFVSWWKTTGLSVSIRPLSHFILHFTCKAVCFLFFVWITNGCIKALVTAKLAFLLQFFMVLKTTDQCRSSWKILFNEHRFRASLYIIWLEAAWCLWSAEHWIKLQINCSWCVERPLIILVTEARSENSVCSALLLRSNLLKTVNSFGFHTKRRKAQHVRVQTQPSFTSWKSKGKTKWQAHFEACEWEVVGDRLARVSGIWSVSAVGIFSHGERAAAASNPGPRHICSGTTLDEVSQVPPLFILSFLTY